MSMLSVLLLRFTNILLLLILNVYTVNCDVVHGRYTSDITDYDLTVPRKISSSGKHITFQLREYYKHDFKRRKKRDGDYMDGSIHYRITYRGVDHHLELWPNHGAFSPNLVIERYEGPDTPVANRKIKLADKKQCYYIGRVSGDNTSRVALSACDGLAGYILKDGQRLYIEPLADNQPNQNGEHVHIVYRSDLPRKKQTSENYPAKFCTVGADWQKQWKERLQEVKRTQRDGLHSEHRYLEVLVVADFKFVSFHKKSDLDKYVLTIMNMVSDFYHDASAGNQMDVIVVRIMYIDKETNSIDLETSPHAEDSLANFCQWQETINPADHTNPIHHDIAVLLTRYDICADNLTNCDLMGLAYVAAACTGDKPCAINEDTGMTLGVVVAHEMGHILGCSHDNEVDSPCKPQAEDGSYHLLSPFVHLNTSIWSPCSRKFITSFFEQGLGDCLNDEPLESLYQYPDMPPGAVYDADFQCRVTYSNPNSTACKTEQQLFCKRLYCRLKLGKCSSNGEPPADGTKCAENKWCYNGQCTQIGQRPIAVDGGWDGWQPWSECSRTCGGGITFQERECTNPYPRHHGRYCLGERKRVKMCNTDPCAADQPSFREVQCSEWDNKTFKDNLYTWKPYLVLDQPCALNCINDDEVYVELERRVLDGTLCKPGSHDRCIFGACRKVGCDMKIDSNKIDDICGVCDGDGTECEIVEDTYTTVVDPGYQKITTFPVGARNIFIDELDNSPNTIAVGLNPEGIMYLNADYEEDNDGVYNFGGVNGIYEHPQTEKEVLNIAGPLTQDINLYVVFYEMTNPGVHYRYALPLSGNATRIKSELNLERFSTSDEVYEWEFLEWTPCSKLCNSGIKISRPDCVTAEKGRVSTDFCKKIKPQDKIMICNPHKCRTRWRAGVWGKCVGCKNKASIKIRAVNCISEAEYAGDDPIVIEDEFCSGEKPASKQLCCDSAPCPSITSRDVSEFNKKLADLWYEINEVPKEDVQEKPLRKRTLKRSKISTADIDNTDNYDEITHECSGEESSKTEATPKSSCNMDNVDNSIMDNVTVTFKPADIIIDDILPEHIKVIETEVVLDHNTAGVSDQVAEQMGDKVIDQLDFCHEKVLVGKEGEDYLKSVKDNTTSKPN